MDNDYKVLVTTKEGVVVDVDYLPTLHDVFKWIDKLESQDCFRIIYHGRDETDRVIDLKTGRPI